MSVFGGTDEGAVYGGTTQQTALSEVQHYGAGAGRVVATSEVNLSNVLDLTSPSVRQQLGVTIDDISRDSDVYTHQVGTWAQQNGYDGILAPSARDPNGSNLVIFP